MNSYELNRAAKGQSHLLESISRARYRRRSPGDRIRIGAVRFQSLVFVLYLALASPLCVGATFSGFKSPINLIQTLTMKQTAINSLEQFLTLQQLLTRKDISCLIQICTHSVARAVKKKLLKEIKFNARLLRYHPADVLAYILANYPLEEKEKQRLLTLASAIQGQNQDLYKIDNNAIQNFRLHEAENASVSRGKSAGNSRKTAKSHRKGGSAAYNSDSHVVALLPNFWLN